LVRDGFGGIDRFAPEGERPGVEGAVLQRVDAIEDGEGPFALSRFVPVEWID
jgi:hypothetical protein